MSRGDGAEDEGETAAPVVARKTYRRRRLMDVARLLPVLGALLFAVPLMWPDPDPYPAPDSVSGMPLSQAMAILGEMVKCGNLDGELMKIFLQSGDYMAYAEEYLSPEQIDEVDIDAWLADYYVAPEKPVK